MRISSIPCVLSHSNLLACRFLIEWGKWRPRLFERVHDDDLFQSFSNTLVAEHDFTVRIEQSSLFHLPLAGRSAQEAFVDWLTLAARLKIVAEEFANQLRDFMAVRLQSEVSGIEQMHRCIRNVAFVGRGTGSNEDGIVLPP